MRGQQGTEARVLPADQRFDAFHLSGAERVDRLVNQVQRIVLDRVPQRGLQVQPVPDVGVHMGLEGLGAPLSAALGAVHGHVRVAEQFVGDILSLSGGDTDAQAHAALRSRPARRAA